MKVVVVQCNDCRNIPGSTTLPRECTLTMTYQDNEFTSDRRGNPANFKCPIVGTSNFKEVFRDEL